MALWATRSTAAAPQVSEEAADRPLQLSFHARPARLARPRGVAVSLFRPIESSDGERLEAVLRATIQRSGKRCR